MIDRAGSLPDEAGTAENAPQRLTARSGFSFTVRPATPRDEAALGKFFSHVTAGDLRFRFLTGLKTVGHDRLVAMTDFDHRQTENFLAFADDQTRIIATAMLACDAQMQSGEVAIAIVPEHKGKGASWELLGHIAAFAKRKGLKSIESVESRSNLAAISMEREMGFVASAYPEDATLIILRKDLTSG